MRKFRKISLLNSIDGWPGLPRDRYYRPHVSARGHVRCDYVNWLCNRVPFIGLVVVRVSFHLTVIRFAYTQYRYVWARIPEIFADKHSQFFAFVIVAGMCFTRVIQKVSLLDKARVAGATLETLVLSV